MTPSSVVPAALQRGGIGLYEWDPSTGALTWDETLAGIFAAPAGEEPLQTWLRRTHPEDQARIIAAFAQMQETEATYRIVLDDGSIRHVLSRATQVVRNEAGCPLLLRGVMLDVTSMHAEGARITSMLESISEGFIALDRQFRFLYLNSSAERVLGRSRAELLGGDLFELFPLARGTQFEEVYTRVMNERVEVCFEDYYPHPLNIWVGVRAQPSEDGMLIYFQDITAAREQAQESARLLDAERTARLDAEATREQLVYQAAHDSLTGLYNRDELARRTTRMLSEGSSPTLLFLDLDRFKLINDTLGHMVGDALLALVAERVQAVVRSGDVVARLGGDEFALTLSGLSPTQVEELARRLLASIALPLELGGRSFELSASIGLAVASVGSCFDTLLRDADVALYRAKDAGRNTFAWFDAAALALLQEKSELEAELRLALAASAGADVEDAPLRLHLQPVFDSEADVLVGAEALARWFHPVRGQISPGVFIPLAEEAGLISQLTELVLSQATALAVSFAHLPDFRIWVNVSAHQLRSPGLASMVLGHLFRAGLLPSRLGIELTESALADGSHAARELAQLADAGVEVAIDDFGTGYSSLARLNALPIHVLKIDRSFVRQLETAPGRAAANAIVSLAHALGMRTVAEGIETEAELAVLQELGSDHLSGFLLGRPAPAAELPLGRALPGAAGHSTIPGPRGSAARSGAC